LAQRSRPSSPFLPRLASTLPLLSALLVAPLAAQVSLVPTHTALLRQSIGAREAGLAYLLDDAQVHDAVRSGLLATMRGNDDYYIHPDVRHAAARPEVKVFVERLAQQYRATCGEKLVITSLVRPRDHQPWNSDPLSVHPTGMAVDMRIPSASSCRRWLESTLLDLEGEGLIEAAREHVVPHYHVVVFPGPYASFLAQSGVTVPPVVAPGTLPGLDTVLAKLGGPDPFVLPSPFGVEPAVTAALASTVVPVVDRVTSTQAAVSGTVARRTHTTSSSTRHTVTRSTRHTSKRSTATTTRYRVRSGDTLWNIAKRHGVSVASLRRANRLPSHGIHAGQTLLVPVK